MTFHGVDMGIFLEPVSGTVLLFTEEKEIGYFLDSINA